jgi:hypothetical protein
MGCRELQVKSYNQPVTSSPFYGITCSNSFRFDKIILPENYFSGMVLFSYFFPW